MKRRLNTWLWLVAGASIATSSVAWAGPNAGDAKRAEALNAEGRALSRAGKWAEARGKFAEAYAKVGTPGPLFNLAWAEQNLGHYKVALGYYRTYLALPTTEKVTAQGRADAQRYSVECAAKLCTFDVRGATKVTVDGEAPTEVEPGEHRIEMQGIEGAKISAMACRAGEVVVVEYPVTKVGPAIVVPPPARASAKPPAPVEMERGSWIVPGVLGGIGVVGVGVGLGFGAAASSRADAVVTEARSAPCADFRSPACTELQSRIDGGKSLNTGAIVGYVVGGTFLVGAVIATVVTRPWEVHEKRRSLPLVPSVSPEGAGFVVTGRF